MTKTMAEQNPKLFELSMRYIKFGEKMVMEGFSPREIYLATRLDTMINRKALVAIKAATEEQLAKVDAEWDGLFAEFVREMGL